ncbi:uncharacterized protein LOC113350496 [Papaver somniferum]|uniref:uncharacterized protein LOC113350496 n=1 Tax=Papaver somniferum TaxID=3469 RepID=UPI000E6FAA52|nr:uncharacterized protein LOC113350496 [Papaver somniferum]
MVYTEKQWGFQQFWIQLPFLLPEHMNVDAVTKIREIMGEVVALEPKDAIPVGSDLVKVCVNIDLTNPLRRGVKTITNAGITRWIKFFYERRPSGICTECYVIKHYRGACRDASIFLAKAHEKPYFFGKENSLRKSIVPASTSKVPAARKNPKNFVKSTIFVPPKDGVAVNMNFLLKEIVPNESEDDIRLGKRQRAMEDNDKIQDQSDTAPSSSNVDIIMNNQTAQGVTIGDTKVVNAEKEKHVNPKLS